MIVVSDTSVLIGLCRVGLDGLLTALFREVVIPPEVAQEFQELTRKDARFHALLLPSYIRLHTAATVPPALQAAGLDRGETAALSLALEIHADAVLMDERRGVAVAGQFGIPVFGVVKILLRAKSAGLIGEVAPALLALQRDVGFWLSDSFRREVLKLAGEV